MFECVFECMFVCLRVDKYAYYPFNKFNVIFVSSLLYVSCSPIHSLSQGQISRDKC